MAKKKAEKPLTYQLFPDNPRFITQDEILALDESLGEYGSLDGIVVNVSPGKYQGAFISGNQKVKIIGIENIKPALIEQLTEPSVSGTVAFGYVEYKGENFPYREVYWSEIKCEIGNLRANNLGGHNDPRLLRLFPESALQQSGIDIDQQEAAFRLLQNFIQVPDLERDTERYEVTPQIKQGDDTEGEPGGDKLYGSQEGYTTFTMIIPVALNEKLKKAFSKIKEAKGFETTHECLNEIIDLYEK